MFFAEQVTEEVTLRKRLSKFSPYSISALVTFTIMFRVHTLSRLWPLVLRYPVDSGDVVLGTH